MIRTVLRGFVFSAWSKLLFFFAVPEPHLSLHSCTRLYKSLQDFCFQYLLGIYQQPYTVQLKFTISAGRLLPNFDSNHGPYRRCLRKGLNRRCGTQII